MPVLTKEVLIGTKHLRHLNVSANMLNDVRDGVISNLTALEVLDISHNFLTDKVGLNNLTLGTILDLNNVCNIFEFLDPLGLALSQSRNLPSFRLLFGYPPSIADDMLVSTLRTLF